MQKRRVLMVCLGNSCRSPMAEAIFQHQIKKMGLADLWEVDSAAILGYHVGKGPEPRAISTLQKAGIIDYFHIARQITHDDFYKFDWIFGMDEYIIHDLYEMQPENSQAKIELLGKYDPNGIIIIRDPVFDVGCAGFEKAFQQALRSICTFLEINKKVGEIEHAAKSNHACSEQSWKNQLQDITAHVKLDRYLNK